MPLALRVRLQFHPKRSQWREKLKCRRTKTLLSDSRPAALETLWFCLETSAVPENYRSELRPPARRQIEEDLRGYLDWITQAEDLEIDPTTTPHVAAAASAASRKASSAAIAEVKALQEGDGEDGCSPSQQPAANGTGSDGDNGSGAVLLPP